MRRSRGGGGACGLAWLVLASLLGAAAASSAARGDAAPAAAGTVAAVAGLGPRPQGSPAQGKAAELLLAAMRRSGLREVRAVTLESASPVAPVRKGLPLVVLEGVLPGATDREIVLSGHYDTVSRSPGADDDASGCAVAIAAAADLARTPLFHTVRFVLFDGEEKGLLGSRAWVAALSPDRRARILADLNLEMLGWPGSPGPTLHALPVRLRTGREPRGGRPQGARALPPGWLVHALLRGGDAMGWPLAMSDPRFPLLMQLVQRSARIRFGADGDSFQSAGIPAVTLSDSSFLALDPTYHKPGDVAARLDPARLETWTGVVAASVRRLDRLAGPPVGEDQYLVIGGRVWLRRDLLLAGFLLWALLVLRGVPGRWRGASPEERKRLGRRYLPGFAFRVLLLLAVLTSTVLSVLLFPAAALALVPPRTRAQRRVWLALGFLPLAVYEAALAVGVVARVVNPFGGFQGGWGALVLILVSFLAWGAMIGTVPALGPGQDRKDGRDGKEEIPETS
jgi:Peptidase family M28